MATLRGGIDSATLVGAEWMFIVFAVVGLIGCGREG